MSTAMDFTFDEAAQAISDLSRQILDDKATNERQRELEKGEGHRHDPDLWSALADAGLLGACVPEAHGGAGLDLVALGALLEQAGRTTAPVPLFETLVLGALPIGEFGVGDLAAELLSGVASGETILTAALVEVDGTPDAPSTTAAADGDGYVLTGSKICVPAAQLAGRILVPATTSAGAEVFLVDPTSDGVVIVDQETTAGTPEACVELSGVRVTAQERLGSDGQGADIIAWLKLRAVGLQSVYLAGVCAGAVELTAEFTKTRKQFETPIATFQAVAHRAADAYIDTETIRLTALQALWRLSEGLDSARQVAVAKYFAAEAGQRVVHAGQHLHGGIGVDRDYPLHRYFLAAKQGELYLGGATQQLLELGRLIAAG